MRKLAKVFDDLWSKADKRNRQEGYRFSRILSQRGRYVTYGVYDTQTKKYVLFDTINLTGNFRYNARNVPSEFEEMEELISK